MTESELRGYESNIKVIEYLEENRIYPLEMFDNTRYAIYIRKKANHTFVWLALNV